MGRSLRSRSWALNKTCAPLETHGNVWWRCGESNSGPKHIPDSFLQAQLPVGFRTHRTWQRALSVLAGSIFSHDIPATFARASPSDDTTPKAGEPLVRRADLRYAARAS